MSAQVEILYDEGVARVHDGDLVGAISAFDSALAADPGDASGLRGDLLYHKANALVALERHEEAVPLFKMAVELSPNCPEFLVGLAESLRAVADHEQAKELFERALSRTLPGEELVDRILAGLAAVASATHRAH